MKKSNKPSNGKSLNADKIVRAALAMADKDGIDAVSMRKLATSLGVTAMSLYNHVQGKDALFDLMLNKVVAKIESPEVGGDWDVMMRRRACSMREVLLCHSWAPKLFISRITTGEDIMRDIDATLGCLVTAGFTYAQADWARNVIDSHIYGYTVQEVNYPVEPEAYRQAAAQYLPMLSQEEYPYMHEAAVHIIDAKYDGVTQFTFGLDLILDGLKRWLAQT